MICALPFHPCIKNIARAKSGVSAGRAAVVNGVWPPGKAWSAERGVMPRKAESSRPAGARSCRENGMTLPGHLAGGGAGRGERDAECVAFVI